MTGKNQTYADKTLLLLMGSLLLFGVIMVYDATGVFAQGVFGEAYRLVVLHVGWILVGLVGFFFFYNFDYKKSAKIAYPLFALSIVFLLILAIVGVLPCANNISFVPCLNGANRWFYLNPSPLPSIPFLGVLGFQPSELAKLSMILYLAVTIAKSLQDRWTPFILFLVISAGTSLLVLLQPNMSTATLLFLIGAAMYISSGSTLLPVFAAMPTMVLAALGFILSSDYRKERFVTFLNPGASGDLSIGYHIKQIQIALGSGGIFGVGFGQSRQKFQYLPEVASDSLFAIVGEELGFIGTALLVIVFVALICKGYSIAKHAPDPLGRLLACGVTTWLALQFFINIAAMTQLIPLTGVPIPLVSYGGSSMVFSLMGLGILANVSRSIKR